eukprot:2387383-Amphidinium_carterae.1
MANSEELGASVAVPECCSQFVDRMQNCMLVVIAPQYAEEEDVAPKESESAAEATNVNEKPQNEVRSQERRSGMQNEAQHTPTQTP